MQLLLSQIETAAAGHTKEEISAVIRNVDPKLLSQLVTSIKTTRFRNEINLASAIFSSRQIGYRTLMTRADIRNILLKRLFKTD